VTARLGPQRGFALAYDLTVLVSGFASDAAMLMFIVCDWLREHQPDLLASGAEALPSRPTFSTKRPSTCRSPCR
jgi:hypothetical protein